MPDTPEPTPPTSSITNTSSGAAATGGGVATGAGGIAVGGDVHGGIHIHLGPSPTSASSAPEALARPPATPSVGNPFGDRGKIADPARYFVRQPLTRQIMDELRKGVSLSIVGETQTGKSSLLWYLSQTAPAALGRPASDGAYLSLELVRDDADFFEGLCEALGVPTMRGLKLARALRPRRLIVCLAVCRSEICYPSSSAFFSPKWGARSCFGLETAAEWGFSWRGKVSPTNC